MNNKSTSDRTEMLLVFSFGAGWFLCLLCLAICIVGLVLHYSFDSVDLKLAVNYGFFTFIIFIALKPGRIAYRKLSEIKEERLLKLAGIPINVNERKLEFWKVVGCLTAMNFIAFLSTSIFDILVRVAEFIRALDGDNSLSGFVEFVLLLLALIIAALSYIPIIIFYTALCMILLLDGSVNIAFKTRLFLFFLSNVILLLSFF